MSMKYQGECKAHREVVRIKHPTSSETANCPCQSVLREFKGIIGYLDSRRLYCRTPEKWFGGEFSVKWFGFRPESQSYRPEVGVMDQESEIQPGRPPESEPNRRKKGPEWGFGASAEPPPLKAFLNPPKLLGLLKEFEGIPGVHFEGT